jgi:hypothetical protein
VKTRVRAACTSPLCAESSAPATARAYARPYVRVPADARCAELFASLFEVGRRYKVMNPDKMRGTHGKLMFMLQDAQTHEVREQLGFACVRTILTVEMELELLGASALLDDDELPDAVAPVQVGGSVSHKEQASARRHIYAHRALPLAAARYYSPPLPAARRRSPLLATARHRSPPLATAR